MNTLTKLICLVYLLLILLNSCVTKTVNVETEYYLEEKNDMLDASDIISAITFIPLETNDDFVIGNIRKILKVDNFYYVLDSQTKTIFIYDETGKAHKKICSTGHGPKEYISIDDFIVNENHIILLCIPCKLIYINKKTLNIENEYKFNQQIYYTKLIEWSGNILLCDYIRGKVDKYCDEKIENIFTWNLLQGYIPNQTPTFYECNNELYFYASGNNVIYSIDNHLTFSLVVTFTYDKQKNSISYYSKKAPDTDGDIRDIIEYPMVDIKNIFKTKNGLGFIYSFAAFYRIVFYNNTERVQKLLNIPLTQSTLFFNKQLISWLYPYDFNYEQFQRLNIKNKPDISKHDNPILLIYDLKD